MKQERGMQETEKRAPFVSQPCCLWLFSIQCTFTKGVKGGGGWEGSGGVIDLGWRSGNKQSGVRPAARSEPHTPFLNTTRT